MKTETIEILCCPVCRGDLELTAFETVETEGKSADVIKGVLRCNACGINYPISDGIPNLLPQDKKGDQ
ncbi:MAG: Trm112 family protein [Methanomicrobiales archaeon]|nr:Trm112 family protein [Methanomicrobiales archaeon]